MEAAPHDPTPVEFASLNLDARLHQGLSDRGFVRSTPVQSAVFSAVFAGTDLIACAETGTGKTVGFLLPLMQRLIAESAAQEPGAPQGGTRVLVLAPTRELAVQIEDDFQGLAYHTNLSSVAVYGGVDAGVQERALKGGVDIIVATPGRLLDHMNTGAPNFGSLEVLVLDEADRMLDMGFWPSVRRIVEALPAKRQTLLFSATTSDDVMRAASQIMRDPKMIQIGRTGGLATTIKHIAHMVQSDDKAAWLARFLRHTHGPTLVFVRTKRWAERLAKRLAAGGVHCAALHADRTQSQRTSAVEGFRGGRYTTLVATDIAARGLDIEGIAHVINYEVPPNADAYVHRVGRTGRAEKGGTALTLVSSEERRLLHLLEESLALRFEQPDLDRTTAPDSAATTDEPHTAIEAS